MRVVIDTNVIVSGLYDPDAPPGRVLDAAAEGRIVLCAPESVREELERVLKEVSDYAETEVGHTLRALPIEWIERAVCEADLATAGVLIRDPDDAPVLACGFALACDIVSGDKDFREARQRRVKVWKPTEPATGGVARGPPHRKDM